MRPRAITLFGVSLAIAACGDHAADVPDPSDAGTSIDPDAGAGTPSPEASPGASDVRRVQVWLTDSTQSLARQADLSFDAGAPAVDATIDVDDGRAFQTMDGFGAAITDSSAWLIFEKLSPSQRDALMKRLFDRAAGAGFSFTRVPMGASDFHVGGGTSNFCSDTSSAVYSYDDAPPGGTDPTLSHFSIAHDLAYVIPVLKQALALNPDLKIVSTPWSPPAWMKTNGQMTNCGDSGSFISSDFGPLAAYFVKFLQAYEANGIPIYAITPQNEPGQQSNYPGMNLSAAEEAMFVGSHLGPALAAAKLHPKVLCYDYNWGSETFLDTVLADKSAGAYVAGSAFHCYGAPADGASRAHDSHPDKDVYETECSLPTRHFKSAIDLVIGASRNWSKTTLTWNIALDTGGGPKTGTGCKTCTGTVTIDQATGDVTYNPEYYQLAHASKFVLPGAARIDSSPLNDGQGNAQNVAFKNPDGTEVLLVHNTSSAALTFRVRARSGESFAYTLAADAVATFLWSEAK